MSIITLLTDFGVEDAYVGIMKGVVLSVNPLAVIVDITHHIDPQNVIQAAYIIKSSYRYFPKNTVHIIVVDPGVGGDRAIVVLKMMGHVFLAPDNGVLTLLMDEGEAKSIVRVENEHFFLEPVSQTFHGRDIFAPVGAYLSSGLDTKQLGPPLDQKELVHLPIKTPYVNKKGELIGTIISIDRFGNCITDIHEGCLIPLYQKGCQEKLEFIMGENKIIGLSHSYSNVEPQHPLAVIGGLGYLEIALNYGNAKHYFKASEGDMIRVVIKR